MDCEYTGVTQTLPNGLWAQLAGMAPGESSKDSVILIPRTVINLNLQTISIPQHTHQPTGRKALTF